MTASSGQTTALPKRVLFVCVENSNRSQMAEAFARMHGGEKVEAYSAGSRPSGKINPKAAEAMHQAGYDLSHHRSKSLSEIPDIESISSRRWAVAMNARSCAPSDAKIGTFRIRKTCRLNNSPSCAI